MDRVWFPAQRCVRDDQLGVWPCRELAAGPDPEPPKASSARLTRYQDPIVRSIAPSLVVVTFDLPYTLSGVAERHYPRETMSRNRILERNCRVFSRPSCSGRGGPERARTEARA